MLELQNKLGISDLLAKILSSRVSSVELASSFLSSKIKYLLPDPFHLLDMDKAVNRTIQALSKKEKIGPARHVFYRPYKLRRVD